MRLSVSEERVERNHPTVPPGIKGLKWFTGALGLFVFLVTPAWAVQSVTLAWNASPGPGVAGYRVYYGVASRVYTSMVSVGVVTNATIPGLLEGVTYYFAVTAYDGEGLESIYSNEVGYTIPGIIARLLIRPAAGGRFVLTGAAPVGHTYQILATTNLSNWTVIGTVTAGTNGSFQFTDTNAPNHRARFYRARDTLP